MSTMASLGDFFKRQNSLSLLALSTALSGSAAYLYWKYWKAFDNGAFSDPGLFNKYSVYESFTTSSGFNYPKTRVFFKEHQNRGKLPKDIPLLVFTHGLGGSSSQFLLLLNTLINNASCLAIDFPGCGLSEFKPHDSAAYTTHALAALLASVIDRFRDHENDQKVILIGHSMGCSVNALLASSTSPLGRPLEDVVIGMIAICPRSGSITPDQQSKIRRLSRLPTFVFAALRWIDRLGGLRSHSISRVVGEDGDDDARKRQQVYNMQSKSDVFLRMISGIVGPEGLPGKEVWSGIKVPLHLIAGEADTLSPASETQQIVEWLRSSPSFCVGNTSTSLKEGCSTMDPSEEDGPLLKEENVSSKHAFALKMTIFSSPASHALLYTTSTVRALAGFIETFLESHVDIRLGAAWQLQHLTTSGKWDVKNLTKWKSVAACSEPIAGIFRAMKTMREVDEDHSPRNFVKQFSADVLPGGVRVVVDISHETPVYDPKGLEEGGVEYYKFPTVSKQAPQEEEVEHFIALVDDLRKKLGNEPAGSDPHPPNNGLLKKSSHPPSPTIGVHCHYGFNRTGFFIVCYLIERCGYNLEDALAEFAEKRPKGIRHDHFKNELYVRYAVNMRSGGRRGTILF